MARFASQHGMSYLKASEIEPLGGYAFPLLNRGEHRGCKNVLVGRWQDLPVKEADYWFAEGGPEEGFFTQQWGLAYSSIVIADLAAHLPYVSVDKKTLIAKAAAHLGAHHIDFASEEFNRKFWVTSLDEEFAVKLIDAGMMRWLPSAGGKFGFEVAGSHLLVSCHLLRPAHLVQLLDAAKGFTNHIPREVWAEYGTNSRGGPPG